MLLKIKKYNFVVIPLALFVVAFVLRSIKADFFPLWGDELITARWTELGHMLAYHHFDNNLPLAPAVNLFFKDLFNGSVFAQRFPVILFGSLSVVVFYQLLSDFLKSEKWALLFSLIPLTSFILIFFSQEIRPYSYFLFFALVTIYYGFQIIVAGNNNVGKILILCLAFLTLPLIHYMSWLHIFALDSALILGIILFSRTKLLNFLKLVCLNVFILIAYIPWSDSAWQYAFNNWALRGNPAAKYYFTSFVFWKIINIFSGAGGFWAYLSLGLVLAALIILIARLVLIWRRKIKLTAFDSLVICLFFYLAMISLFIAQMRYTEEIIFERHYLFLIWPFFILMFYSLYNLTRFRVGQLVAAAIVGMILISNLVNITAYYLAPHRFYDWRSVAELVEPLVASGQKKYIYTSSPAPMFIMKWYMKSDAIEAKVDGRVLADDAAWQAMKKDISQRASEIVFIHVITNHQDPEPISGFDHVEMIGKSPYLDFLLKRKASPYANWYEVPVVYY